MKCLNVQIPCIGHRMKNVSYFAPSQKKKKTTKTASINHDMYEQAVSLCYFSFSELYK